MATTKLGNTKSASKTINYAEKRAVEKVVIIVMLSMQNQILRN